MTAIKTKAKQKASTEVLDGKQTYFMYDTHKRLAKYKSIPGLD
jgi:hypothetical protein